MPHLADRLAAAIQSKGNGVLVGLDPRENQLPEACKPISSSPTDVAQAYASFCRHIIDVVADLVPATKPQAAFFEQLGPPGMQALQEVIAYARQKGLIVILDAKRGDIGSTAEAYAAAYLGASTPYGADSLTVNPYLGDDSLMPFVTQAQKDSGHLFVLVKTSNPGGKRFQDLQADGCTFFEHVADHVEELAVESVGASGYGLVGAVVGATYPEELAKLRARMPHAFLLIPGFGAQGGSASDVAAGFDASGNGAIVNSSRGIIFAHQRPEYQAFGEMDWQRAVEQATRDMISRLCAEVPKSV